MKKIPKKIVDGSYLKRFLVRDYIYMTFGLLMYAVGLVGFIKPAGVVTGGLAGVGLLIEYASGFPLQYTYLSVNIILLAFAFKILGFKFISRTVFGVAALTLFLSIAAKVITRPIIDNTKT